MGVVRIEGKCHHEFGGSHKETGNVEWPPCDSKPYLVICFNYRGLIVLQPGNHKGQKSVGPYIRLRKPVNISNIMEYLFGMREGVLEKDKT